MQAEHIQDAARQARIQDNSDKKARQRNYFR
jgi:hypothetical protein